MDHFENGSVEFIIATGPTAERHTHDFLELAFVLTGSAKHEMEGYNATIRAGDYFIVDYGAAHEYRQIGTEPLSVMNVLFCPNLLTKPDLLPFVSRASETLPDKNQRLRFSQQPVRRRFYR